MPDIDIDAPGKSLLLMGNEAIARGALEAGIGFASSYPGTPSSEILPAIAGVAKKETYMPSGPLTRPLPWNQPQEQPWPVYGHSLL